MRTHVYVNTPEDREHLVAFEDDNGRMHNETLRNSNLLGVDNIALAAYRQWKGEDVVVKLEELNIVKPETQPELK